jgi:hypothetical protein
MKNKKSANNAGKSPVHSVAIGCMILLVVLAITLHILISFFLGFS